MACQQVMQIFTDYYSVALLRREWSQQRDPGILNSDAEAI